MLVLQDSAVVTIDHSLTHPQAIPLAMKTMRKSIHRFPLLSYMGMGLHYKCSSLILQN